MPLAPAGLDVAQFVGTVNDDLLCTICESVMVDPHTCQEGHAFCRDCIGTWLKQSQTCPTDRQALSESSLTKHRCAVATPAHCTVSSKHHCVHGQDSWRKEEECPLKCGEIMLRGQLPAHEETCGNMEIACPFAEFGCSFKATRRKMGEHEM
eukprot:1520585-Rhodomonas_salina.1